MTVAHTETAQTRVNHQSHPVEGHVVNPVLVRVQSQAPFESSGDPGAFVFLAPFAFVDARAPVPPPPVPPPTAWATAADTESVRSRVERR